VLQEAAAARNIVIMCGSTTIDGYTFCLGVKSLEFSYTASPELRTLPSVIYLIERAGLRPKITANMSGRFSLEIRSLAELIDMFHSRQATDPRDMVYALLGMSSEDPETTVIQPDYEISWEELFQQLVKSVLGKKMSMEISCQRPVIKCKGCVLGLVRSVERGDRQCVKFTCRNKVWGQIGDRREWTLQASANPIQKHDIICLLYGASKPSIIRLCKDHFVVVVIAATPLKKDWWSRSYEWISWPKLSQLTTQFLRDFLLIWDWGNFYEESQDHGDYKTLTKVYSQGLVSSKAESKEYFSEAARLWNDIEILDELEEYGKADERILEARRGYAAAFGKDSVPWEIYQHGRTLLSIAAGEGHKDITKLLLDTVDPDIKDGRFLRTPLCWAAIYGHEAVIKLLLETGKVEADSKDKWDRTPLWYASSIGHEAVVKLLLESGQVNPDSKDKWDETPLWCATDSGHEAIVKLLLETGEVDVNSRHEWGKTPLSQAADNENKAILKLFLETGKADVDSKDNLGKTLLSKAVDNGYEAIVKLLLETGKVDIDLKDMWGKSPLSRATDKGDEVIVKLLLEFRDQQSRSRLEGSMG
jgi:ankyrin repeat protein